MSLIKLDSISVVVWGRVYINKAGGRGYLSADTEAVDEGGGLGTWAPGIWPCFMWGLGVFRLHQ